MYDVIANIPDLALKIQGIILYADFSILILLFSSSSITKAFCDGKDKWKYEQNIFYPGFGDFHANKLEPLVKQVDWFVILSLFVGCVTTVADKSTYQLHCLFVLLLLVLYLLETHGLPYLKYIALYEINK